MPESVGGATEQKKRHFTDVLRGPQLTDEESIRDDSRFPIPCYTCPFAEYELYPNWAYSKADLVKIGCSKGIWSGSVNFVSIGNFGRRMGVAIRQQIKGCK